MPNPEDQSAKAKKIASIADRVSKSFERQLAAVYRQLERKLNQIIAAQDTSPSAIIRATQASRVRREIRAALKQSGYDVLVDESAAQPLDEVVNAVIRGTLSEAVTELGAPVLYRIEAAKALQHMDLLEEGDQVARVIWRAVVRGIFGGQPPQVILNSLQDVLDRSEAQVATLYDTSVSIFSRQIESIQAGNDPRTRFRYVGPDDDKTRPFCEKHLNKIYQRADIDRMDNGQLPNVFLTGGGYNCRHVWMQVSAMQEE